MVHVSSHLRHVKKRDAARTKQCGFVYNAWEEEIPAGFPDRDTILTGIRDGFKIIMDINVEKITPVEVQNYKSSTNPNVRKSVEQQIKSELQHGHYRKVTKQPAIISALGAIPKKD